MKHARSDYNRIQDPENKIPENEPVFLLRAQDKAAPSTLRFWAHEAESHGASNEIVFLARQQADLMEDWQDEVNYKTPDL